MGQALWELLSERVDLTVFEFVGCLGAVFAAGGLGALFVFAMMSPPEAR